MLAHLQVLAMSFLTDEDGQALTEYGLIMALVALLCLAALTVIGGVVLGDLQVNF